MPAGERYGEGHSSTRLYVTPRAEWDDGVASAFAGASPLAKMVEGDGNLMAIIDPDEDLGLVRVELFDGEEGTTGFLAADEEEAMQLLSFVLWQHITL